MALLVKCPIDGLLHGSRRVLFDLRRCSKINGDELTKMVSIICGVGHDMADANEPVDQPSRLRAIAPLAGCDGEADWQPKRVDSGMDFGGQAALGAADRVSLSPPFAPLASAWALQMVASMRTYSKSGS